MGSTGADKIPVYAETEGSETTIEIKIKTLDSQTYTMRVDKQMPVPALKEQIASVTGVLSEQQRLICRGKVLKDDQLLSAYHVEDGHTLHLVVRQPVPPSSDGSPHLSDDPGSGTSRSHSNHVPNVVIETFNLSDQGDGVSPEIGRRIVQAVLSSMGFANMGISNIGGDVGELGSQRHERTSGSGIPEPSQGQTEQSTMRNQSDRAHTAFGLPAAVSLGPMQPPVIPDSLATLSQYLSHIKHELDGIGYRSGDRDSIPASNSGTIREGLPTPASLAEVLLSTRQMLIDQAGECIQQLARQLEDQANVTDTSTRTNAQSNAWRTGILLQSLGSLLLELGRTTMTLRLGQTPSEAVVNAGPAVFITPTGPIPLMALPFQPGTSLSTIPMETAQPGSGVINGLGTGFLPRRIDIQIRRGMAYQYFSIYVFSYQLYFLARLMVYLPQGSTTSTPNIVRQDHDTTQQLGQRNPSMGSSSENHSTQTTSRVSDAPSFAGESGVRVVPIRTMVAAVPAPLGRVPSDSSGSSMGLYYPLLGRFQHLSPGHLSGERGSQASGEHLSPGAQSEQPPIPESAVQNQSSQESARDGNMWIPPLMKVYEDKFLSGIDYLFLVVGELPNANSRQQERLNTRSANRNQNNQEAEGQIPSSILQFLRGVFPGSEIQVEEASLQGTATDTVMEQAGTSSGNAAAEQNGTDEGVFLSNLLHQIMPYISQHAGSQQSAVSTEEANTSTQAESSRTGNSHRPSDSEPNAPNSKRQKLQHDLCPLFDYMDIFSHEFMLAWNAYIYRVWVWSERNRRVFGGAESNVEEEVCKIMEDVGFRPMGTSFRRIVINTKNCADWRIDS
ncbi:Ubiquitin-like superfamily protein, putative isoform 4 [Hibiscus syriacus]|uniref:Ubiquitin-like superfamily protein, putative isoform 4 n=1 Tax=Hibiscus syriacus TaxID=106335 RepID=A0A6A3B0Y5_HIBSY|nr:Ubiquitin-like superfamily protein, putative isoform 4 [Hibiscus syriacus]